jgi:hypothetical protein
MVLGIAQLTKKFRSFWYLEVHYRDLKSHSSLSWRDESNPKSHILFKIYFNSRMYIYVTQQISCDPTKINSRLKKISSDVTGTKSC